MPSRTMSTAAISDEKTKVGLRALPGDALKRQSKNIDPLPTQRDQGREREGQKARVCEGRL